MSSETSGHVTGSAKMKYGAPIAWIAILAALGTVLRFVPLYFWAEGGGYTAVSVIIEYLNGLILGPIGGAICGLVYGIIGLFVLPAAIPWVTVLHPVIVAFTTGMLANKKWWAAWPICAVFVALQQLVPYYWPGPPTYPAAPQPKYFLASFWLWVPLILMPILGPRLIPEWLRSDDKKKLFIALVLALWIATEPVWGGWWFAWNWAFNLPPGLCMSVFLTMYWYEKALGWGSTAVIGTALFSALRRSGLRKIPGAIW